MSEIRVNTFKAEDGISAPSFPNGIQVTGVVTATVLDSTVPFLSVGDNIQLGNAGVATATTFNGNLTGNATGLSGTPNITVGSVVASTGTFSGNVSIGGTLTYEDVLNIDSVGIVTARLGVRVPDNVYSYFGTGNDLSIRHDASGGNHSYIFNHGAGVLKIGSDTQFLIGKTSNATYIQANPDSDVKLYFNNSPKLATTNTGVTVTGTVSDSKGDVRDIPSNPLSGTHSSHTLVASDAGKVVVMSGNITIPSVSGGGPFGGGSTVTIINGSGSNITLTQGSGLTLYNTADGSTGNRTLAGRGMATIYYMYGGNSAYITGSGLT